MCGRLEELKQKHNKIKTKVSEHIAKKAKKLEKVDPQAAKYLKKHGDSDSYASIEADAVEKAIKEHEHQRKIKRDAKLEMLEKKSKFLHEYRTKYKNMLKQQEKERAEEFARQEALEAKKREVEKLALEERRKQEIADQRAFILRKARETAEREALKEKEKLERRQLRREAKIKRVKEE